MPGALYDVYNSIFEGVLADTPELKLECYRIRYQVYCIEHTGYEDPAAFPDGCERDEHDANSIHALLRHKESGTFVGTVRTIMMGANSGQSVAPIYQLCKTNKLAMPELYKRENLTEISRFCITKEFRRRFLDTLASSSYSQAELSSDKHRILPSMSLGLISMLVLISQQHDLKQWCAEMEFFLLEMLTKLGIHFNPVGPLVDYHGKRQICYRPLDELLRQVQRERPDIWDIITDKGRYLLPSVPVTQKTANST